MTDDSSSSPLMSTGRPTAQAGEDLVESACSARSAPCCRGRGRSCASSAGCPSARRPCRARRRPARAVDELVELRVHRRQAVAGEHLRVAVRLELELAELGRVVADRSSSSSIFSTPRAGRHESSTRNISCSAPIRRDAALEHSRRPCARVRARRASIASDRALALALSWPSIPCALVIARPRSPPRRGSGQHLRQVSQSCCPLRPHESTRFGMPLRPRTWRGSTTHRCPRGALAAGQDDEARAEDLQVGAVEARKEVQRRRHEEVVAHRAVVEPPQIVGPAHADRDAEHVGEPAQRPRRRGTHRSTRRRPDLDVVDLYSRRGSPATTSWRT